jgi:16S rRNA (adenine1518-N6/adenine1519-N6)-dimethyltransferase
VSCSAHTGKRAKKSLGQNFLTHPAILEKIVSHAGFNGESPARALEIGPGPGGLTTALLAAGADVLAIEMDRDVVEHLERNLVPGRTLQVLQGDALRLDLDELLGDPPRVVVANLPYHVATEILFRFVDSPRRPKRMVLMFQREVADRIVAAGATREFGALSVAVQLRYRAKIAMTLPPGAFTPAPKVRSAVVVLDRWGPAAGE